MGQGAHILTSKSSSGKPVWLSQTMGDRGRQPSLVKLFSRGTHLQLLADELESSLREGVLPGLVGPAHGRKQRISGSTTASDGLAFGILDAPSQTRVLVIKD